MSLFYGMAYYCKSNDSHNTGSTCKETLRKLHPSLLSIYIINASKRVSFL